MDLDLLMTYLSSSLKRLNADVEKLRSNQYNNNDVLDHLSSELIMLQNHVYYFGQMNQMQENDLSASQMPGQEEGETGSVPVTGPTGGPIGGEQDGVIPQPEEIPQPGEIPKPEPLTYFTLEQLSQYTGKNGSPAYVAVDGVVYNVTNNRLWAGGNHFWGLTAGKDLSTEFLSCHPGAMVLSVLPVVGYLVQGQGE